MSGMDTFVDVLGLFKDPSNTVSWICLSNAGIPVIGDENWFCAKKVHFPMFDGYQSVRAVKNENGQIFKVICSIKKSSLGMPIFNCAAYVYIADEKRFSDECYTSLSLRKITTLSNSILQKLNVATKKSWYGLKFFGLDRKDVREIQTAILSNNGVDGGNSNTSTSSINYSNSSFSSSDQVPVASNMADVEIINFPHIYNFLGIESFGKRVEGQFKQFHEHKISPGRTIYIPDGYVSHWTIKCNNGGDGGGEVYKTLRCYVNSNGSMPVYKCVCEDVNFISLNPTICVKNALQSINCIGKKKWSGYDFFGFSQKQVFEKLHVTTTIPSNLNFNSIMKDISNIHRRHSGPTSLMKDKRAIEKRNQKINSIVELASQGDVKSYVSFLIENHPQILDESINENAEYKKHLAQLMIKDPFVKLSREDSAALLVSKSSLTEREYKSVRDTLRKQNVTIASYEEVSDYIKSLDIGSLDVNSCDCNYKCMSCVSSVHDTLNKIMCSSFWYDKMQFMNFPNSCKLFDKLKEISSDLYGNLDPTRRTLFVRMTGDNFRAACKRPTEQISYSLLNNASMLHSPYGQFISSLWGGSENRKNIESHTHDYHMEMKNLLKYGGQFTLPNGESEIFNVIPIVCADLGFIKDILGKCSTAGLYGCYYCKKSIVDWDIPNKKADVQTMSQMMFNGKKGVEVLGEHPVHGTKDFTTFQHNHFGQYSLPLFDGFELLLMPPCGLHLILAHHRYLWSYVMDVILRRKQDHLITKAFAKVDCHYLALQYKSYHSSKNKLYDGSPTLKMIGEDCKQMEKNIEKFVSVFLSEGQDIKEKSCESLRKIVTLYKLFSDIALDIRSIEYNSERANSFSKRVDNYYQKFRQYAPSSCSSRKPYMHILREHISSIMLFWGEHLGWGYGYFNCNGGEHLNKRIKAMEYGVTNMKDDRFMVIMRFMRVKQFFYPEQLLPSSRDMTCSACKQKGHNKKNKNCPLHPSQVQLDFSDTDDEI